jgi:hypothetical protein
LGFEIGEWKDKSSHGTKKLFVVPIWILMLATGFAAAHRLCRWRKFCTDRRKLGLCPHCGYDVRATPDRCSECGFEPTNTNASRQNPI